MNNKYHSKTFSDQDETIVLSEKLLSKIYKEGEFREKKSIPYNLDQLIAILFVLENDDPLARVAFYSNAENGGPQERALLVGNFECVDNKEVAAELFSQMEKFATSNNFTRIIGPVNGSTWDNYRFALTGDFPRFFTEEVNKEYYPDLFYAHGYDVMAEYVSTLIPDILRIPERLNQEKIQQLQLQDIMIRNIHLTDFEEEISLIYHFSMEVFAQNILFSPIGKEYFLNKYLPLKSIIDPQFCLLAFDKRNQLVALFFCLPDIRNSNADTLIIKTIAVKPGRFYAGVIAWMFQRIVERAKAAGYKRFINAFMNNSNISKNISDKYKGEVIRTYHLFNKSIIKAHGGVE